MRKILHVIITIFMMIRSGQPDSRVIEKYNGEAHGRTDTANK